MAAVKDMPVEFTKVTSLAVMGDPEAILATAAELLANRGQILKQKAFAVTARILTNGASVVIKCRVYKDKSNLFLEATRRNGDSVLFCKVWQEVREALRIYAAASDLAVYEPWCFNDFQQFAIKHDDAKHGGGKLDNAKVMALVEEIPLPIRKARLKLYKKPTVVMDEIDELLSEATAYFASHGLEG